MRIFVYMLLLACVLNPDCASANGDLLSDVHNLDDMLPAGRWGLRYNVRYGNTSEKYDNNGHRVGLAAKSDGIALDATAIPVLALLGPGATLGTTSVSSRLTSSRQSLSLGYGWSDDLTAGVIIPYGTIRNTVSFSINGGNVAFNPLFNPALPIGPLNFPLVPVGVAGTTQPVGTNGVREILTNPIYGYGYKPFSTTETSGLLDPIVGMRWRLLSSRLGSAVLSAGVRFGLAEKDDPDNLADVHLDDGSTDIFVQLSYQRKLSAGWDVRGAFGYTVQTPDHVTARAYTANQPLAPASHTERLDRDLGDVLDMSLETGYRLVDWRLKAGWDYSRKYSDNYTSPSGQDVTGMEVNSKYHRHALYAGVDWSGVNAWRNGVIGIPLLASMAYRAIVQGENAVNWRYLSLEVTGFF